MVAFRLSFIVVFCAVLAHFFVAVKIKVCCVSGKHSVQSSGLFVPLVLGMLTRQIGQWKPYLDSIDLHWLTIKGYKQLWQNECLHGRCIGVMNFLQQINSFLHRILHSCYPLSLPLFFPNLQIESNKKQLKYKSTSKIFHDSNKQTDLSTMKVNHYIGNTTNEISFYSRWL